MEDDFPKEFPRVWVLAGVWLAALLLAAVMVLYTSTRVEAQEAPLCAPADIVIRQFSEIHKEPVAWEGTVPLEGEVAQVILLQGDKNTWTLFSVRRGIACIIASGRDGTPINDKGV
jgi:hypothetical protein